MSRRLLGLATAILIALPCAAMADVYQTIPVPASPGTTPQRLSPRQVFRWLDANHDGFLSLNEFLAAPWIQNKRQATRFFRWMDTNHDGLVSLQEFLAAYTRYSGSDGYYIRVAYPWAWTCWRPWRYGWYWQSGWHRRPGVWPGYAVHCASLCRSPASCHQARRTGQASSPSQARQGGQARQGSKAQSSRQSQRSRAQRPRSERAPSIAELLRQSLPHFPRFGRSHVTNWQHEPCVSEKRPTKVLAIDKVFQIRRSDRCFAILPAIRAVFLATKLAV